MNIYSSERLFIYGSCIGVFWLRCCQFVVKIFCPIMDAAIFYFVSPQFRPSVGTTRRIRRFGWREARGSEAGEESSMSTMTNRSLAMGVAAAISLGGSFALGATGPAQAAPLSVNALALKEAAPKNVVDVHRRSRRYGGHAFAGLALGVIGAVIAHQAYKDSRRYRRHHYYQPYGYYGPPSCIRKYGAVYCR
jgi:hypothetical protein